MSEIVTPGYIYKLDYSDSGATAPFYEPVLEQSEGGSCVRVSINRNHQFYLTLYLEFSRLDNNGRMKASIDLILFALGRAEVCAATEEERERYRFLRTRRWSPMLMSALDILEQMTTPDEADEESEC